jgi:nucleoside-diphosphate-sugar epimerase
MTAPRPAAGRTVLVIGGAGYVGTVLVRALLTAGFAVRVLDNFLYGHGSAIGGLLEEPGFVLVQGDLCDGAALDQALRGATDVVLLASLVGDPISRKYPKLTLRVNRDGHQAVFEALHGRGIDRFVFTSTCSNYGLRTSTEPASEEAGLDPKSLYAETKVEFERFVMDNADGADFMPTVLRIATAYGLSPRMRFDLTVSEFTRDMVLGRRLVVYDKDTWRPYCHVRDIAQAIIRVLQAPGDAVAAEVFNVGANADNFTKQMIVDEVLKHVDAAVHFEDGGRDPRNYRVSFDKIHQRLGFAPAHSVPAHVPRLIGAIAGGLFPRVDEMGSFYGNYEVAEAAS